MVKDCSFCVDPNIHERTIARDDLTWTFLTVTPIVPGHVLVCPSRCVEFIEDLTPDELQALFAMRLRIKQALVTVFDAEGFNYAWNEGRMAGQTVPHVHLHIVPRTTDDEGIWEYEPRKFLYRPGSRESAPQQETATIARELAQALSLMSV